MLRICSVFLILIAVMVMVPATASADRASRKLHSIKKLYDKHEKLCLEKGWKRLTLNIDGRERQILWQEPEGGWSKGAIIALHGGGGTYSNYCSTIPLGKPMEEFSELALQKGFAVFSLDSGRDIMLGDGGSPCGKRWFCYSKGAGNDHKNPDIKFIEQVVSKTISEKRSKGGSNDIFIAGISNGGFMTALAATRLNEKIEAFAMVSSGDPYGVRLDCGDDRIGRVNAPGLWYDRDTDISINKDDACFADEYKYEMEWPQSNAGKKIAFKQFHHRLDSAIDISCMKKAQKLLVQHGYQNDGEYVVKGWGGKRLWKHFWSSKYNEPLVEFFEEQGN